MGQREKIVDIALSQVGYVEGENNENKYGEAYGMNYEPWCDIFVWWCANAVGISEDIIPKYAYVPDTANWYDKRNLYKNSKRWGGDYTPQKGDLILFDYDETSVSDHIGIIVSVNGETIRTVEGNKDNAVKQCEYNLNDRTIRAYCTPEYKNSQPVEKPVYEIGIYQNGSTKEPVYADTDLKTYIGCLGREEVCECFGIFNNRAIVRYHVDNTQNNYKIGFVKWLGGVK